MIANEQLGSKLESETSHLSNKREGNSMQIFTFVHTRDYRLSRGKKSLSLFLL